MQNKADRIMLESTLHEKSSFVTLTYNDEHLPADRSLSPDDLKHFLMRLRTYIYPLRIRYFACGEYGGTRFGSAEATRDINPHYHLALYGMDYTDADIIQKAWSKEKQPIGLVDVKFLEPASALYLAKYVTKKMTGKEDERLRITEDFCLHPEFQRQSLKPGLGAGVMDKLAVAYKGPHLQRNIALTGDISNDVTFLGKTVKLGRYLQSKLRERLGFKTTGAQEGWQEKALLRQMLEKEEITQKLLSLDENKELDYHQLQHKIRLYKIDVRNMKRAKIENALKQKEKYL